jgi:hypothetical protein
VAEMIASQLIQTIATAFLSTIGPRCAEKQPWTRPETERLILKSQEGSFCAKDFGRNEKECTEHLADVLATIFGGPGEHAMNGIRQIASDMSHDRSHTFSSPKIAPALTEVILRRFLIEKKSWSDLEVGRLESEKHFQEVLQWVCKHRCCSMNDLLSEATNAYYDKDQKNV